MTNYNSEQLNLFTQPIAVSVEMGCTIERAAELVISIGELLELKPQGCVSPSLTQPSASLVWHRGRASGSTSPGRARERKKQ